MKKQLLIPFIYAALAVSAQSKIITLTIDNQNNFPLSVDLVSASCSTYLDGACKAHYTYNFQQDKWDTAFDHDAGVIELKPGENSLSFDSRWLEGGARLNIAKGKKSDNFQQGMSAGIPGNPDPALYSGVYDKIELGWTPGKTAVWNITYVDFFGMPIQLSDNTHTVGVKTGETREGILKALTTEYQKEPAVYDSKYYYPAYATTSSDLYRIFSPQHFYVSLNTSNPWDSYINIALDALHYGKFKHFQYGPYRYSNFIYYADQTVSVDYENTLKASDKGTIYLSEIKTGNVVAGVIGHSPKDNEAAKIFAGMLSAVLNRGVINSDFWGTSGIVNKGERYYQYWYGHSPEFTSWMKYNPYAKVLTSHAIDNKIYAVSYDDYWHMDNGLSIGEHNADEVVIRILPFN